MRWMSALVLASAWLLLPSSGRAEPSADPAAAPVPAQASSLASSPASSPGQTPQNPAEEAKIDGFRSAAFGMTEPQLRQAIRKDFPAPGEKIASEPNAAEKTSALTVQVPDLIPGA